MKAKYFIGIILGIAGTAIFSGASAATLSFNSASVSANVDEAFSINLSANTSGSNVVVVNAKIIYDPTIISVIGWDTSGSVFASGNTCINNGKFCNIETNDAVNGILNIVAAKPSPGINTSSGQIANITFKALKAVSNNTNAIKIQFLGSGNYTDSDIIIDDDNGTDILTSVSALSITASGGTLYDINAPAVSISAPSSNATVSGSSVIVSATASDNIGVVGVQFMVDGLNIGAEDTTAPYSVIWDTTQEVNGTHSLTAIARDAAGNQATSAARGVVVSNSGVTPTLSVVLSASPSSGAAPLNKVSLTAVVSGTQTENINYTFYCSRTDTGKNITTPYSAKLDNTSSKSYTATGACSYANPGTYTAKIIVEQGTLQAEHRVNITVNSSTVTVTPGTCQENWDCQAWSSCTNGMQTRVCTDRANRGTTVCKPAVTQSCSSGGTTTPPSSEGEPETTVRPEEYAKFGDYITRRHLVLGYKGDDIKNLQEFLKLEGFYNGDFTGTYGSATKTAVEKFQVANNIAQPGQDGYGEVGIRTRTAINNRLKDVKSMAGTTPPGQMTRDQMIQLLNELQAQLLILLQEYLKILTGQA